MIVLEPLGEFEGEKKAKVVTPYPSPVPPPGYISPPPQVFVPPSEIKVPPSEIEVPPPRVEIPPAVSLPPSSVVPPPFVIEEYVYEGEEVPEVEYYGYVMYIIIKGLLW
jgi:hypothetical protein